MDSFPLTGQVGWFGKKKKNPPLSFSSAVCLWNDPEKRPNAKCKTSLPPDVKQYCISIAGTRDYKVH